MSELASELRHHPGTRVADRLVAAFLILLMAAGSFVLWIGIPAGCLYAASQLTDSGVTFYLIAIGSIPLCMVVFAGLLFWLNGLYARVTGLAALARENPEEKPRFVRGPLEPLLVGSLVVALVALFIWFFGYAENPQWGPAW